MTPVQKLAGLVLLALVLMAGTAVATWEVQDWRYGKQLAEIGESTLSPSQRPALKPEQKNSAGSRR